MEWLPNHSVTQCLQGLKQGYFQPLRVNCCLPRLSLPLNHLSLRLPLCSFCGQSSQPVRRLRHSCAFELFCGFSKRSSITCSLPIEEYFQPRSQLIWLQVRRNLTLCSRILLAPKGLGGAFPSSNLSDLVRLEKSSLN